MQVPSRNNETSYVVKEKDTIVKWRFPDLPFLKRRWGYLCEGTVECGPAEANVVLGKVLYLHIDLIANSFFEVIRRTKDWNMGGLTLVSLYNAEGLSKIC